DVHQAFRPCACEETVVAEIDTAALKANFAEVAGHGPDVVAQYFYGYLLLRIVTDVDNVGELVPYLEDLGRDHRKFGTLAAHYPAVGEALITTLRHFSEDSWTDKLQADWTAAYGIVADTMSTAAQKVDESEPAWWDAEITQVDLRTFDIAVLKVRTQTPHPYVAGQSISIEPTTLRPREWRLYTPANAPGGLEIELHVRLIDGGPVSTALVRSASAGDKLRLGPPIGQLTLDPGPPRPLLLIGGSTGLAPL